MDLLNSVLGLFSDSLFYARLAVGLLLWYLVAVAFAHLFFGRGSMEVTDAAVTGAFFAMGLVAIAAALLGFYVWGSVTLAVGLGVTMLVLPFVLTLGLRQLGKR